MPEGSDEPEQTAEGLALVAAADASETVAAAPARLCVRALSRMRAERAAPRAPGRPRSGRLHKTAR